MKLIIGSWMLCWSLISLTAQAGGAERGNGGNAVVCYEDETKARIESIQLFDYWEMDQTAGFPQGIQLGEPGLPVAQKIGIALDRIRPYDPDLAQAIKSHTDDLLQNLENYLVPDSEIPTVRDSEPKFLPAPPCYAEQFAVQWKDEMTQGRRFAISRRLYNHAKTVNDARAGILLHEAIYRVALSRGQVDSDGTRYFNYSIATQKLETASLRDYVETLELAVLNEPGCELTSGYHGQLSYTGRKGLCLPFEAEAGGLKITAKKGTHIFNRAGGGGDLDFLFGFNQFQTGIDLWVKSPGSWKPFTLDQAVYAFFQFGQNAECNSTVSCQSYHWMPRTYGWNISGINLALGTNQEILNSFSMQAFGTTLDCGGSVNAGAGRREAELKISDTGVVFSCNLKDDTQIQIAGQNVILAKNSAPIFYDQNHLAGGAFAAPATFKIRGTDREVQVKSGRLDLDGKLVEAFLSTPILVPVLGESVPVQRLNVYSDEKIHFRYTKAFPALYAGRRILKSEKFILNFCQKKGFEKGTANFKVEFIAGKEEFYDGDSGNFITKSAEAVELIEAPVSCSGDFQARL